MEHENKLAVSQQSCGNEASPSGALRSAVFLRVLVFLLTLYTGKSYGVCLHEIVPPAQVTVCLGSPVVLDYDICDSLTDGNPVRIWWFAANSASPSSPPVMVGTQIVYQDGSSMPLVFNTTGVYTVTFTVTPPNSPSPYLLSSGSNNSATVTVIDQAPQGFFTPPFVSCTGSSTSIHFTALNSSWQDLNQAACYIDFGDVNNLPMTFDWWTWGLLTNGIGLSFNYPTAGLYTVTLYLENACGDTTITQDYLVTDQIVLSPVDLTICENSLNTIQLSANAPQGVQVNWYDGQTFLGTGDTLIIPAPSSTTTYTAEAITNCSNPANVVVTVVSNPRIDIDGPANDCSGGWQNYSIVSPYSGVGYNWSISGGTIVSANQDSTQIWVNWNALNSFGPGVLTAWSDGIPCLAATVFYVEPCCFKQSRYTYSIDGSNGITFSQALGVPAGTTVVLSSSGFVVGGMTYTNLLISGIVSVDLDLYFDNNLVVSMMADASIVVQSGYRLTVDNHSIIKAACKEMWKSIWVSGGGEIVLNNGAVIQDGEFGTFLMGDAKITSGDQGDQVVYNKNYFGMFFLWHNAPSNVLVRNTRFMCRASGTTLTSDDELLLPHQGEHSAVGIALAGTQTALTIGEAVNGKHNEFDFLDYGILSVGSQLNAVNNQFVNIIDTLSVFDCACNCPRGVGICADAEGSGSGLITQIGDFGPYEGNSVTDSDHGFYLVNNMNGIIRNNNLLRTRFDAMNFNENWLRNGFYEVDRNTSKGVGAGSYHIFMNNNPNVNKTIVNNEINEQYVPSNLYATGIGLFEMVKAPATVKISDNDLYNLGTGIYTLGLSQTTIARNEIELNAEPNAIYGAGISANKGSRFTISENTITAANRDNWWVDGIRITDLVRSQVSCNLMQRTASGVFLNGNCTDTYIRQNNMRRNYWGYILNHAVNPLQQGGFYSDNIWTGPYDNNTAGGTYWHTLNMNSNVFANAINVRPYSGMGNVYKPNPFYSANSGGLNFSPGISPFAGPIYFPSGLNYHSGCNADTTAGDARHFNRQIVSGNFDGHDYKDNTKWLLRYQLFETLTEKGLEKMTDPFLIMFVDSMSNSAAGSLLRIQKSISDNGYADVNALEDIRAKNNSITTLNSIETLYRFVNDRILQTMINSMKGKSGDNSLHTEAMEKIKTIALMCPFESGPAVYLARALYQEVGKEHVTFLNPCETVSPVLGDKDGGKVNPQPYVYDPTEADDFVKREGDGFLAENDLIVFPNPADEFVRIQSQRSISRIEIMDVTAKGIHYVQGNNDFSIGIAMKDFAKGIYLMKVFYSEEEYVLKKLVVAH